jgi:hypothetical protein
MTTKKKVPQTHTDNLVDIFAEAFPSAGIPVGAPEVANLRKTLVLPPDVAAEVRSLLSAIPARMRPRIVNATWALAAETSFACEQWVQAVGKRNVAAGLAYIESHGARIAAGIDQIGAMQPARTRTRKAKVQTP